MKHLPVGLPSVFFYLHATLEVHSAGDELHDILREVEEYFPGASFLDGLRGLIHYHVRGQYTAATTDNMTEEGKQSLTRRSSSLTTCTRRIRTDSKISIRTQTYSTCQRSAPNSPNSHKSSTRPTGTVPKYAVLSATITRSGESTKRQLCTFAELCSLIVDICRPGHSWVTSTSRSRTPMPPSQATDGL